MASVEVRTDGTMGPYFPEEREGWHGYIEWEKYPEKRAEAARILAKHKFASVRRITLVLGMILAEIYSWDFLSTAAGIPTGPAAGYEPNLGGGSLEAVSCCSRTDS